MAPATSSRPRSAGTGVPGTSRSVSSTTRIPIGKLTRKIQCQLSMSVRMPPSSTPMLPPPEATNPKIPIAFARSPGSVKRFIISESETADATAPPMPWTERAATRNHCVVARPHASEATVKTEIPAMNKRWCPNRSPSLPPSRRKPP
jgi:hypothetical protein